MPAAKALGLARYVPDCRVEVDGQRLMPEVDAHLFRVEVDLDAELIGQCKLRFTDPQLKLINGDQFGCGTSVRVLLGFGANLGLVFEGEVVALAPRFVRDEPPSLEVTCDEILHRLALSQSTRSLNDVDARAVARQIATAHGLSCDAPEGTHEHLMQPNVSDLSLLRRVARRSGSALRIEGKKLVVGQRSRGGDSVLHLEDGIEKVRVELKAGSQVGAVTAHGWDVRNKQAISGRATPQGEVGEGARQYGRGSTISLTHQEMQPPDSSTAEATARGRMARLAEQFVQARIEMIGSSDLLPGREFSLEKIADPVEGKFRVEHARHVFDKRGYRLSLEAVRIEKKPINAVRPQPAQSPLPRLFNARWENPDSLAHDSVAQMTVEAENLDGQMVYFLVQHKVGESWRYLDEGSGQVSNGRARGEVTIRHPAVVAHEGEPNGAHGAIEGPRDLRFHVSLTSRGPAERRAQRALGSLANAHWSTRALQHGEETEMAVDADSAEGRTVYFYLEHDRGSGDWEQLAETSATVQSGRATARLVIEHPAVRAHRESGAGQMPAFDAIAGPRNLRFHASFTQRTE